MATAATSTNIQIPSDLIDAIQSFPTVRQVEHCGEQFTVSPFDIYASCPKCSARIKLRAFSAHAELAHVFDAVFEWMNQPGAEQAVDRRRDDLMAEGK